MRLTCTHASQCLMPHVYLSRLPSLTRSFWSARPMMCAVRAPVARSNITLGRMPRPGPHAYS